jgi:hypothetical protein
MGRARIFNASPSREESADASGASGQGSALVNGHLILDGQSGSGSWREKWRRGSGPWESAIEAGSRWRTASEAMEREIGAFFDPAAGLAHAEEVADFLWLAEAIDAEADRDDDREMGARLGRAAMPGGPALRAAAKAGGLLLAELARTERSSANVKANGWCLWVLTETEDCLDVARRVGLFEERQSGSALARAAAAALRVWARERAMIERHEAAACAEEFEAWGKQQLFNPYWEPNAGESLDELQERRICIGKSRDGLRLAALFDWGRAQAGLDLALSRIEARALRLAVETGSSDDAASEGGGSGARRL